MVRRFKLTTETIKAALKKRGPQMLWDGFIPGFGLRIQSQGGRAMFVFRYYSKIARGDRWLTFGEYGKPYTADAGRVWASEKRRLVDDGKDPAAAQDALGSIPSLATYVPRYLDVKANRTKPDPPKPATIANDKGNLERICTRHPRIAAKQLHTITAADVRTIVDREDHRPSGNRWLAVLRHLFNTAAADTEGGFSLRAAAMADNAKWNNPCDDVSAYTEHGRAPEITDADLGRLFALLDRYAKASDRTAIKKARAAAQKEKGKFRKLAVVMEHEPFIASLIKLQALTGARGSEIRTARWSWLAIVPGKPRTGILKLPDSKEGGAKEIMLSSEVLEIIESLPRIKGCDFIFPGASAKSPIELSTVIHWWSRNRAEAGLDKISLGGGKVGPLRLHDLRHNVAAVLIGQGASLAEVGELLGHKSEATSKKYASLMSKAKHDRAAKVASAMMERAAVKA